MKVLVIHAYNPVFRDDTDVFCDELKKLGHEIIKLDFIEENNKIEFAPFNMEELKDIDLIWAPYEIEIRAANYFKETLKKPLLGHFEWIAPWRVGDSPEKWGYDETNLEALRSQIPFFINRYGYLTNDYFKYCDHKTIIDDYLLGTIETFSKQKIEKWHHKPYIIDDELLLSQKDDTIKTKYQILSTARLVPHKKIHHIIQALAKVRNAPPYKVIGVGPELQRLIKLAKDLNVDVEFVGTGQNGVKAKLIQESMFSINIWAGLPIGESALFKKHSLSYYHINLHNACGDMASYVEWDNIDELAERIQYLVDNPEITKELGEKSYDSLMSGKNNIVVSKVGCLILEKVFKECIK